MPALYIFSRIVIGNSRSLIDDAKSIIDESRVKFQLKASFAIAIYNHHFNLVQARRAPLCGKICSHKFYSCVFLIQNFLRGEGLTSKTKPKCYNHVHCKAPCIKNGLRTFLINFETDQGILKREVSLYSWPPV